MSSSHIAFPLRNLSRGIGVIGACQHVIVDQLHCPSQSVPSSWGSFTAKSEHGVILASDWSLGDLVSFQSSVACRLILLR